jgi:pyruvate-ferredoxin/flavodoxin oxidoreductase
LTTHTVEDVRFLELELMKEFVGNPNDKLLNLMDPYHPIMSGIVQNQDSYMKGKIAQRAFYDKVEEAVVEAMGTFYQLTGRRYELVETYRLEDADFAVVGMGSMLETAEATVDYLREKTGLKVGALHVTSFRPFPGRQIVEALKHLKAFAVIERMDNPIAQSNPLTMEIKSAFTDAVLDEDVATIPKIYSGSAGLGSRDVRPGQLIAAFDLMAKGGDRAYFSLGIDHETALELGEDPDIRPDGAFSMRGHSIGGFGSVTTNKIIADVVGDLFGLNVQAYPKFGAEKKGLPTTYYLTVAKDQIRMHAELNQLEFIPLNDFNAFYTGRPVTGLAPGGTLFINTPYTNPSEIWKRIPPYARETIRDKKARILALDASKIAREVASDPSLEVRMQGIVLLGIYLKVAPFVVQAGLTDEQLFESAEEALERKFGKLGEQVVQENLICVKRGYAEVFEIPAGIITEG